MAQHAPVPRTLFARAVLIDTGAFFALAHPEDTHHEAATTCLEEIARRGLPVIVPMPVIYEAHRLILHALGRARAVEFLAGVFDGSLNLERVGAIDEDRARAIIARYGDVRLTLTDAASMAVMERLSVGSVFSFDADFLIAGFLRVPPLPN